MLVISPGTSVKDPLPAQDWAVLEYLDQVWNLAAVVDESLASGAISQADDTLLKKLALAEASKIGFDMAKAVLRAQDGGKFHEQEEAMRDTAPRELAAEITIARMLEYAKTATAKLAEIQDEAIQRIVEGNQRILERLDSFYNQFLARLAKTDSNS